MQFFFSLLLAYVTACCFFFFSIVIIIQIEVMRARNRSTLLIIIKCCSVSFILTANVYTVSILTLYVCSQQQWQPCDKAIHFTVIVLYFFFLSLSRFVVVLLLFHLFAWVRIAINWNNKLYWILRVSVVPQVLVQINCHFLASAEFTPHTITITPKAFISKSKLHKLHIENHFVNGRHKHAYKWWKLTATTRFATPSYADDEKVRKNEMHSILYVYSLQVFTMPTFSISNWPKFTVPIK